jgi:hypothetical protein
MLAAGKVTTDRDFIIQWVEQRGGWPAVRKNAPGSRSDGTLLIGFPETDPGVRINRISWEEFFTQFERARLSFIYEETGPDGELSRFCYLL